MQEQVEQLDGSEDGKLGAVPRARAPLLGTTLGTTQGPLRAAAAAVGSKPQAGASPIAWVAHRLARAGSLDNTPAGLGVPSSPSSLPAAQLPTW